MTSRRCAVLGTVLAVLLAAAGCGAVDRVVAGLPGRGPAVPPGTVELATGSTQGVYFRYGTALAGVVESELPGVDVRVRTTEGSVENLQRVAAGDSTFGFAAADAAADAVSGQGPFPAPLPVRAVARVYDEYIHLVVRADSPLRSAGDLRGRRVSVGQTGSGTEIVANRLLAVAGLGGRHDLRAAHLGITDSAEALREGRLDAFFWQGGLPTAGVVSLAGQVRIRLLPLGGYAAALRRYSTAYRPASVPAGSYPGVPATLTVALPSYIVTRADTDPDLAYQLTRLLFASRERIVHTVSLAGVLDARAAIETFPVELHPGALRYYRDRKP